jgi:tetratricopeptide (TPR) repeat protein
LVNIGEYQQAITDYDHAIQLDPKFALAYDNRATAYHNLGQYQRAIADYDHLIELGSRNAALYNRRGLAYFNLKEYQKAIADYDQAIQLDPKDSIAIRNREAAYELMNARLRKANPIGADSAQNQQEIAHSLEGEIMHEEAMPPQQRKDAAQQPYLPISPQSAIYQSEPQNASYPGATVHQPTTKLAIASLVFGIIGVLTSWLIVIGLPFSFVGLVLAVVEIRRNGGKGSVNAGLVLSIIGILIALAIFGGITK